MWWLQCLLLYTPTLETPQLQCLLLYTPTLHLVVAVQLAVVGSSRIPLFSSPHSPFLFSSRFPCPSLLPPSPSLTAQGEAVVLPAYPEGTDLSKLNLSANEGQPIHFLISAPTMRIPTNVSKTANSYLAFRAVLRAGKSINREVKVE